MKQIFVLLILVTLVACTTKTNRTADNANSTDNWTTFQDTIEDNFIMTFKYPDNLIFADIVDNCRCVGKKLNYKNTEDPDPPADSLNTRHWSICIFDPADDSVDYLLNSWKTIFKGKISELRDTIRIADTKALRVILKSNNKNDTYRQLIYLEKYSTLFEVMNIYEDTNKDFEKFYNSMTINETTKPSP